MKRLLVLGLAVVLILPVDSQARSLFLQTADQFAGQASVAADAQPSADNQVRSFSFKYADASDMAETIKGVLAKGEGVSVNKKLNMVFVRASTANQNRLAKLVDQLDKPPLQVQVEARIIELKTGEGDTTNPSALGVNWRLYKEQGSNDYVQQLTTGTISPGATSAGLYAQLLSGNVEAYLSALQKTIGYDLVAAPWISALNHEEAEILIGSKLGYRTSLTTLTGTLQEIKFLEVGTKLKFVPHINEDGYIIMEVSPAISEGTVVNELPNEDTTETRNKVLVKDGQSVVIGGLNKSFHRQVEIGVPILSHLPLIGALFRRTELQKENREIMVIITPHIVTPQFLSEMAGKLEKLEARQQRWNAD